MQSSHTPKIKPSLCQFNQLVILLDSVNLDLPLRATLYRQSTQICLSRQGFLVTKGRLGQKRRDEKPDW